MASSAAGSGIRQSLDGLSKAGTVVINSECEATPSVQD